MSAPVEVLAVLSAYSAQHGDPEDFEQARAAVAELIEAAQRMERAVGGGARCEARAMLRAAVARAQGQAVKS